MSDDEVDVARLQRAADRAEIERLRAAIGAAIAALEADDMKAGFLALHGALHPALEGKG